MNAKDFFMLVYKTRQKQKEFYKCKNPYEKARLLNECASDNPHNGKRIWRGGVIEKKFSAPLNFQNTDRAKAIFAVNILKHKNNSIFLTFINKNNFVKLKLLINFDV